MHEEEGEAAAEVADPVGDLHDAGALVLLLGVHVPRGGVAEERVRLAQALAGRGEERHRGVRPEAEEGVEVSVVDHQRHCVLLHQRARHARAAVDQRDLAEEIPLARGLEDDALARVVLEEQLHHAGAEHVERVARIPVVEHDGARRERLEVQPLGQGGALCLVEERDK